MLKKRSQVLSCTVNRSRRSIGNVPMATHGVSGVAAQGGGRGVHGGRRRVKVGH